jgi:hypothetical protein
VHPRPHSSNSRRIRLRKRIDHHARAQVGTADADADDIGDIGGGQRLDHRAHPRARAQRIGVRGARRGRLGHFAAQCRVQRGAAFGHIDRLAIHQALHRTDEVGVAREREQRLPGLAVVRLPGETGVQRPDAQREIRDPRRVVQVDLRKRSALQAPRLLGEQRQIDPGAAHAACLGIDWLVWVSRFWRST